MILIKVKLTPSYKSKPKQLTDTENPEKQPMYVCLCKAVTDSQIHEAVQNGATHFGQLRKDLGFASQCGKCGIVAREVFNQSMEHHIDDEQLFYAVS